MPMASELVKRSFGLVEGVNADKLAEFGRLLDALLAYGGPAGFNDYASPPTAAIGGDYIDHVVNFGPSGEIRQGSGDWPATFTGLRIWRNAGAGVLNTYNAGVSQVEIRADGGFYAGAGAIKFDANGFTFVVVIDDDVSRTRLRWNVVGVDAGIITVSSATIPVLSVTGYPLSAAYRGQVALYGYSYGLAYSNASVLLYSGNSSGPTTSQIDITANAINLVGDVYVNGTVGVGIAPSAVIGVYSVMTGSASGATIYGAYSKALVNNTTTNGIGLLGKVETANVAFTLSGAVAIWASNPNKGAASTITTAYGLLVEAITSGVTNYAIYTIGGQIRQADATDTTSATTGSVITAGGLGVAKAATVGTTLGVGQGPITNYAIVTNHAQGGIAEYVSDAGTTNVAPMLRLSHLTSGTAGVGFGTSISFFAEDDGGTERATGQENSVWVSAASATRKARTTFYVYDTAAREGLRIEASGTAPMIGFLGAAAVVRQTLGAAATDPATTMALANNIRTALLNLGLGQT